MTTASLKVLVVCSGNTCRSPITALFLRELLSKRSDAHWQVESAGYKPTPGQPIWHVAHSGILAEADRLGIDRSLVLQQLDQHKSRSLATVVGRESTPAFLPDTVIFMEQDRLDPIRETLRALQPSLGEPNWVLLNVRDMAFDLWESLKYPASSDDFGYARCEREYAHLATAIARRAAHLSRYPELLETSSSPFSVS